ncbi:MAG: hypothetical protein K6T27_03210 [Thermoleophilum sp.]|nr:hypothetical protein [Thermoleophilum sp.]
MGVLVTIVIGLLFWVAAWAFGAKAIDAFLVTVLLAVAAAAVRAVAPSIRRGMRLERDPS